MALALALVGVGSLFAADLAGIYVPRYTRDLSTIDGRLGTGAISVLGPLAWAGAAAVLGFAGLLRRASDGVASRATRLLAGSAAYTAFLGLSDAFALHEHATRLGGTTEVAFALTTVAATIGWLAWARPLAERRHRPALLLAGALFAASLTIDRAAGVSADGANLLGDATKVGGILAYTAWAGAVAWAAVRPPRPSSPARSSAPWSVSRGGGR